MFRVASIFVGLLAVLSPLTGSLAASVGLPAAEPAVVAQSWGPNQLPIAQHNASVATEPPAQATVTPILEIVTLDNSVVQKVPKNPASVAPPVAPPADADFRDAREDEDTDEVDDNGNPIEDARFWHKVAMKQLVKTIKRAEKSRQRNYRGKAKNIIIFIGDGMGMTTITAGRIYKGQYLKRNRGEEESLTFDDFPYTGLAKTYNVDMQVPDSAGTATAIFSGSKTAYGAVGMDMHRNQTDASRGRLRTIMDWAQAEGKRTGIVTTTRITHATPSSTYARVYHRDWECDSEVPEVAKGIHADIGRQLVENAPGNRFNVILGGGLQPMGSPNPDETTTMRYEGPTEMVCHRFDQRNLTDEWVKLPSEGEGKRAFVQTLEQLNDLELDKVDHLMGLFRNNHITYAITRQEGEPSLEEMTQAAIKVLDRGDKGFVLMVEGGRIDMAHHQNYARAAMHEVMEFDKAVAKAVDMTDDSETLIIVTADHSHSFTFNGYAKRGSDILGFANKPDDLVTYEALSYANGPGYWDHLKNATGPNASVNANQMWIPLEELSAEKRSLPTYRHMATVAREDESHGGEDVVVFAQGPGASLIGGTFEQNYLAYVMSYAGCMGPAKDYDASCRSGASGVLSSGALALLLLCVAAVAKVF